MTYIPAKPEKVSRQGTVTAYTANASINIQDKKGNSSSFIVNSDTKIILKKGVTGIALGDEVTIAAQRNPAETQFTAKSISDSGAPKTKPAPKTEQTNKGTQKTEQGKKK